MVVDLVQHPEDDVAQREGSAPRWSLQHPDTAPETPRSTTLTRCPSSPAKSHNTIDDPTGAYSNPTLGTSGVTVYSTTNGSSTPIYAAFTTPVAAIKLTLNALLSAGGKVTATIL
jgi:hypothetical protein